MDSDLQFAKASYSNFGHVKPGRPSGSSTALPRSRSLGQLRAFTLIEMLVVIAILGILASIIVAYIIPKSQQSAFNQVTAELHQFETAIDSYHADFGAYPPDNPSVVTRFSTWNTNQADYLPPLYYELEGSVANTTPAGGLTGTFGSGDAAIAQGDYTRYFGLAGPQNSSPASLKNYLTNLRPAQAKKLYNTQVYVLTCSIGTPASSTDQNLNPWNYNRTNPTNNPATYDLYNSRILVGNKYYTIGNWSR